MDDEFDCFEGLQDAHDAYHGTEDAAITTREDIISWWGCGEDAAVTGTTERITGRKWRAVEDHELSVLLEGGGGHDGLADDDGNVGDEITGCWMVRAVKNNVVCIRDRDGVRGCEIVGVCHNLDGRVQATEAAISD